MNGDVIMVVIYITIFACFICVFSSFLCLGIIKKKNKEAKKEKEDK